MIAILSIIFCINYKYMKNYKLKYKKYKKSYLSLKKSNLIGGSGGSDVIDSGANIEEKRKAQLKVEKKAKKEDENKNTYNELLITFIEKSKESPANYWQHYLTNAKAKNVVLPYEDIGKDKYGVSKDGVSKDGVSKEDALKYTYNASIFKLVNKEEIDNITKKCEELYINKLLPSLYSRDSKDYQKHILKYSLPANSKIAYFGDYHSSLHSLIQCLEDLKKQDFFENNTWEMKENRYLVFLGDLVDRGPYGIECLYLLYLLFIINNQTEYRVFIINGNHEEQKYYKKRGFKKELNNQINNNKIIDSFENLIKKLPLALFLTNNNKDWYQFCHGGIDASQIPVSTTLGPDGGIDASQIPDDATPLKSELKYFLNVDNNNNYHTLKIKETKPGSSGDTVVPTSNRGFLWSDFTSNNHNPDRIYNEGRGWIYPAKKVAEITKHNNIITIISGHQDLINYGVILRPVEDNDEKYVWDDGYYKESSEVALKTLKVIQDAEKKSQGGTAEIDMNDVSATIISSSTISKLLKFSIYGILDLQTNKSNIIWIPACNTTYLKPNEKGKIREQSHAEKALCNIHLKLRESKESKEMAKEDER